MASTETQAATVENGGREGEQPRGHYDLKWRHEYTRLKIGRNHYTLRTLSLLDAVLVEPHWHQLCAAIAEGHQPMRYALHLTACVKVLCPLLLDHPKDAAEINRTVIDACMEFYGAQDWTLLEAVRAMRSTEGEGDDAGPGMQPRAVFYAIAAACAQRANMDLPAFMDARLEFALDTMLTLNAEWRRKQQAGKMPHRDFITAMLSAMGGKSVEMAKAPAWIQELHRKGQELDAAAAADGAPPATGEGGTSG